MTAIDLARACAQAAISKKGKDVLIMDLQGISGVTDFFVLCTGANTLQVRAIAENIEDMLKDEIGVSPMGIEGEKDARWILMDYANVVVHVFQEEERQYYKLERLWGDAKFIQFKEQ